MSYLEGLGVAAASLRWIKLSQGNQSVKYIPITPAVISSAMIRKGDEFRVDSEAVGLRGMAIFVFLWRGR